MKFIDGKAHCISKQFPLILTYVIGNDDSDFSNSDNFLRNTTLGLVAKKMLITSKRTLSGVLTREEPKILTCQSHI